MSRNDNDETVRRRAERHKDIHNNASIRLYYLHKTARFETMNNDIDTTQDIHVGGLVISEKLASDLEGVGTRGNQLIGRRTVFCSKERHELLIFFRIYTEI